MTRVLVVRPDGMGDVLLAGPAIRAIAARAESVTLLCGPGGAPAGAHLPGIHTVLVDRLPWIDAEPLAVDRTRFDWTVEALRAGAFDEGVIFTSFHQDPLPTALLLRLAGIPRLGAISRDYPGSLLDVRHQVSDDMHEVERALSLVAAMGYDAPADDALDVAIPDEPAPFPFEHYIVVHPGASVPARTLRPSAWRAVAHRLASSTRPVIVTGLRRERALVEHVADVPYALPAVEDSFTTLARTLRDADVVVVGNTGPAHLAAAVRTPVVSCFPPTVPAERWRPWGEHVLLGDQAVTCRGCRARECPRLTQVCLDAIEPSDVLRAVEQLSTAGVGGTS
jgi:ADP-heptose:LPS heptosyltransferase